MAVDPERHARTIASLTDSSYDVIIASFPTEVLLLTGYWPVIGDSIAFFTSDGEVRVVLPEDEVELAEETSSAKLIPYKPNGLHTLVDPLVLLKGPLQCVIDGLALPHIRIGLQLGQGIQPSSYAVCTQFRSRLVELLRELAPASTYLGCDELLEDMKAVKTTKELELMQTTATVAAAGFAKAARCIRPGLRETDVAAAAQSAFETTGKAEGLQRSYGYFFCIFGPNSARPGAAYARTRQRLIEDGDLVMIHANTCADGYWTDLTRTYIAGETADRHCDIRAAIDEARTTGLRAFVRAQSVNKSITQTSHYGVAWIRQCIQACRRPWSGVRRRQSEWRATYPSPLRGCARDGRDIQPGAGCVFRKLRRDPPL